MKKIWTYSLLMAGVLAAAVAAQQLAREPSQGGIFYKVTGGKNEMYLLGSIHVGSKDMYPMCKAIQQVIQQADVLVFECDTTSPEAMASTAQMMKASVPLSEAVSENCYRQVERAAEIIGYSIDSFNAMKPWAVTSTLTVAAAAEEMNVGSRRMASAYGVENMVRKQANGKHVAYLETAEEQLSLMDSFSQPLQEYLLESACRAVADPENVTGTDEDVEKWPEWWKNGNAQAFADSYRNGMTKEKNPELAKEYHHALMTVRNVTMAQKLQEMLEDNEPHTFIATVGLMHLVLEEDSIITQLRSMGYTVEQIRE